MYHSQVSEYLLLPPQLLLIHSMISCGEQSARGRGERCKLERKGENGSSKDKKKKGEEGMRQGEEVARKEGRKEARQDGGRVRGRKGGGECSTAGGRERENQKERGSQREKHQKPSVRAQKHASASEPPLWSGLQDPECTWTPGSLQVVHLGAPGREGGKGFEGGGGRMLGS